MQYILRKVVLLLLVTVLLSVCIVPIRAENPDIMPFNVDAQSAVLMDYNTGTVLYAKNADKALPPASVTKIMTLLIIMEAIDSGALALNDTVSVSEYASSMGGSQVYLEPGEAMSVEELLKCVIIASANDAAVALAEKVAGTEEAFVTMMNTRASELGMHNTKFENVTGLDDDTVNHLTSAYDIAIMSRALLAHEKILEYSSIWMDSIRSGTFGLTNTNRLIRFYDGATGLKTGSTSKAKFCISATAKRDDLHLIAVIMGAGTREIRNDAAKALLDWGFTHYSVFETAGGAVGETNVVGGVRSTCIGQISPMSLLLEKGKRRDITTEVLFDTELQAPVHSGDVIGSVRYIHGEEVLAEHPILAAENVEKISFFGLLTKMIGIFFVK